MITLTKYNDLIRNLNLSAGVVIDDSDNDKTYVCYPAETGAVPTAAKWLITQIFAESDAITHIKVYKTFEAKYAIQGEGTILAALQAYDAAGDFVYFQKPNS
jgi:hypothetical protein